MKLSKSLTCLLASAALTLSVGTALTFARDTQSVRADSTSQEFSLDSIILEYQNDNWFLWFVSEATDWPDLDKMSDANYYNIAISDAYLPMINVSSNVLINGKSIREGGYYNGSEQICMWCRPDKYSLSVKNLPDDFSTLTVPKGTIFPSYQTATGGALFNYVIAEDENYNVKKTSDTAYAITRAVTVTEQEDNVSSVNVITGYNGSSKFILFTLAVNDYTFSYNGGVDYPVHSASVNYAGFTDFTTALKLNGDSLVISGREVYLNYYANIGSIAVNFTDFYSSVNDGDVLLIPKGTTFPSYSSITGGERIVYKTTEDASFTFRDEDFHAYIETSETATSVGTPSVVTGYNGTDKFLILPLSVNDYDDETLMSKAYNNGNDYNLSRAPVKHADCTNFAKRIALNGETLNLSSRPAYINYYGNYGGLGINFTAEAKTLRNFDHLTVPAGTSFPSFNILIKNGTTIYVTSEDITYTYYEGGFHLCAPESTDAYVTDETSHWTVCSVCASVLGKEDHVIVSGHKDPTCTEPGYDNCEYCSVCGYVKTEGNPMDPLGHDFDSAGYLSDEIGHWKKCSRCEELTEKSEHVYAEGGKTCTVCGYVKNVFFVTVLYGYIIGSDASEFAPGTSVSVMADTPESGKMFEAWYVGSDKVSENSTYTFVVERDVILEARYTDDTNDNGPDIIHGRSSSGCSGSIAAASSLLFLLSLAGPGLLLFRKKER